MARQVLLHLPDDLARRFRRSVPARQRSAFVQRLLEHALPPEDADDDPLYIAAREVEGDETLASDMADWDVTVADGLDRARLTAFARTNRQAGGNPAQPHIHVARCAGPD